MWNRGKLVILCILAVALGAASFSLWYNARSQRRILDFWGSSTALLIAEAPHIEALRLGDESPQGSQEESAPASGSTESTSARPTSVEFGERSWSVEASHEALKAHGMLNLRRALVVDTTFDWRTPAGDAASHWQYALEFNDGRNWATLLFDFASRSVALTGGKKTALLDPAACDDFRMFFAEQFPAAAPAKE